MDERTERLLQAVWGSRQGFVFLPYKQNGKWVEAPGISYTGETISLGEPRARSDHYFCPVVFSEPTRRKEFALPTNVLWADLDPVNPESCRLRPSIAWESSPGRYQALWFLTTEVTGDEAAALSKRIAYADGGDKGGWDLTQVLRIPGTRNHKYPTSPEVKFLWAKRSAYSTEEIRAAYPPVNGEAATPDEALGEWPDFDEPTIQMAVTTLPVGLRRRLTQNTAGADRSKELQLLARDLLRFGTSPDIVKVLLQRSTWNKFVGRPNERQMLLKQVADAQTAVAQSKAKKASNAPEVAPIEQMKVHEWGGFMSIPTSLKWLVDDAWVDGSVGFISGRSKSYKTWIALDLALSIVSGFPFLGRYEVRRTGPVLLVQEEDPTPVLQERLRLIGKAKGMLPEVLTARSDLVQIRYPEYPLHIINLQGFNLGSTEKVAQVRAEIARINPVLVILDPLIVLLPQGVDEYKGAEVSAVLQAIKMWREEFGCAISIVHHWNKGKSEAGERFAEHMYGSFAFHAWLESALHIMPIIPDEEGAQITEVMMEREFKAAPSGRSQVLKFNIDTVKDYVYEVGFGDNVRIGPKEQQVLDILDSAGPSSTAELVAATGLRRPDFVELAGRLVRAKVIMARKGGGRNKPTIYWLPTQDPPPEAQ